MSNLTFLLAGADEIERQARLRELRALSLICLGRSSAVTIALGEAIADPDATDRALDSLNAVPALRRRRLLSAYGALLPRVAK